MIDPDPRIDHLLWQRDRSAEFLARKPEYRLPAGPDTVLVEEPADAAQPAEPDPAADPHLAGRAAQARYLRECREQGVEPSPEGLDAAYWSVYRSTSQWGAL